MPWRKTQDPYHIWLSEIILQQTRVAQGLPYYLSFIKTFPTVFDLAEAQEDAVLKLWQGLGYYSRARNLHSTAKIVANEMNGIFPKSYKELLKLKGVGDYTASAIASICYNEVVPVLDGNVYRVLSRYFNITTPINQSSGAKEFKKLAWQVIDAEEPATYNQAIMEFGALQCKPQNPYCIICPLNSGCMALEKGKVSELPIKLKKVKIKKRFFHYIVFHINQRETVIQQRKGKGIWQNLYEFPLLETSTAADLKTIKTSETFKTWTNQQSHEIHVFNDKSIVHKLSHQHIYTTFYIVTLQKPPLLQEHQQLIPLSEIHKYPVPVLIATFLGTFLKKEFN